MKFACQLQMYKYVSKFTYCYYYIPVIVTFLLFKLIPSSHSIVYPLILDCAVNDIFDTSGDSCNCSIVNTPPIIALTPTAILVYDSETISIPLSSSILHDSTCIGDVPVTVHWYSTSWPRHCLVLCGNWIVACTPVEQLKNLSVYYYCCHEPIVIKLSSNITS